jgi:predicted RNA-binding protein YlxR (DUF448 family)
MSRRRRPAPTGGATGGAEAPGALDSTSVRPPGPVRTCVGCRARAVKTDLLRVVADGDRLVPDPAGRLPGRGASVHRDPRCVDLADKRRAFPRALRLPGPLDLSPVREAVRAGTSTTPGHPSREQVETPHEHSMSQSR